jgi:DNA polymerase I-like protein with 3'-5' exonuclease and polymerase domains
MTNIQIVSKPYQFANMLHELLKTKFLGVDTETTGLDPHTYHPLLISLYDGKTAYVIDLLSLGKDIIKQLKPILESHDILKIGHNLSFEWKFFYHTARIDMQHMHDIMIVDRMIYAGLHKRHTLKDVVLRRLDIEMDKTIRKSFIGAEPSEIAWSNEQLEYSAMDAVYPVLMYPLQMTDIADKKLECVYTLEMNIIAPTAMMEYTGVNVNRSMLEAMIEPFEHFVRLADKALQDMFIDNGAAESIIFTRAGYSTINTASSDQVQEALNRIGIKVVDNKGKPSLGAKIVQRWDMLQRKKKGKKLYKDWQIDYHDIIEDDEVANALTAYIGLDNPFLRAYTFLQGARKLLSTYVYGMINAINPKTKRIHPHFNSYGAESTGRYSSNDINFQNLPNDKKLAVLGLGLYSLRKTIEAPVGRKLVIADYSGIELVILAANSGDKKLMEMIIKGDVHTEVTVYVLGYTEITQENRDDQPHKLWRDAAKTLSYGIAYGTTGRNIAETMNIMLASVNFKIDAAKGDEYIAKWFSLFPDTHAYLMKNAEKAVRDGFVVDAWGRRRNWNRDTFIDKWKRLAAMREGQNMPIQGTSATMTKRAIELLWQRLDRIRGRIIITVHDEIVLEVADSYLDTSMLIIKECMETAIRETLPIVADQVGLYKGTSVSPKFSDRYDK